MAFNAVNKAPGVYIDEILVPGPIAGVGTSTAAFVGPAEMGPINQPTRLTNPTQFTSMFGGYITDPMVYATHAVHAFFANGGTMCYFVRAGTGKRSKIEIVDASPAKRTTLVVTAKQEGTAGDSVSVSLQQASLVSDVEAVRRKTELVKAEGREAVVPDDDATTEARDLIESAEGVLSDAVDALDEAPADTSEDGLTELENAVVEAKKAVVEAKAALQTAGTARFQEFFQNWRPGDVVFIDRPNDETKSDRATIDRVRYDSVNAQTVVVFRGPLESKYPPGQAAQDATDTEPAVEEVPAPRMRIADLMPGDTRIRLSGIVGVEPGSRIEAGSYIVIAQGEDDVATEEDESTHEGAVVKSVDVVNKVITLDGKLRNAYDMRDKDDADADVPALSIRTLEFTLTIKKAPGVEVYRNLSIDPRHSRYFGPIVQSDIVDIVAADPPSNTRAPDNRPFGLAKQDPPEGVFADENLTGGVDEDITKLDQTHFSDAINTLERIDEVNILSIPDSVAFKNADGTPDTQTVQSIQADMIAHCEKMQDRFAVLDPLREDPGATAPNRIVAQREQLSSDRGFAALYYPWIYIKNPLGKGRVLVPPSGHIAGLYARVDDQRGVHKAPANEAPRGVLGLELSLADNDQGPLNEAGINVIRFFPGRGIRVWGARTIAPKDITQWRYVNVRRLVLFIEESIQEATQFAVFEPNELGLWKKLERQVTSFLTRVWRDGALFGATAEQAFRVTVNEELNPPDKVALGILTVEVIVRPTSPAEFVVFRVIADPTGDALIQE